MIKSLQRGWSRIRGLGQGIAAAKKWMLAYTALILLPASVMLFGYYQRSSQILEEEVSRSMQMTLKQAGINLSYRLNHIQDISNSLFMNRKLYEYLDLSYIINEQIDQSGELMNLLQSVQTKTEIVRARIFVDTANVFGTDRINTFPLENLESSPWHREIIDGGGRIVWTGGYKETYLDLGEQNVISCARMLRNPRHFEQVLGVLMIDVSDKMISEIISELDFPSQIHPYIMDRNGMVIYSEERSLIGTLSPLQQNGQWAGNEEEGITRRTEGKEDRYVVYSTIRPTGWKLVAEVPKAAISRRATALNQFSGVATLIGMTLMFLILAFVLMAFVINMMNRRIKTVLKLIRTEGIDRLEEQRPKEDGDFHLLERSVDYLIHRVKNLMEEAYRSKMLEREAQLKALQAQINPHFLYNALDTINWLALAIKATDISKMIEGLSDYFRLSLNKGKDHVSITDELELARVYLEIQQSRFPASFTFDIEADMDTDRYLIPKLTLQPIVENALLHGIRKAKGKTGRIVIRAEMEADRVRISVKDDGIGMSQEMVDRLLVESRPDQRPDGSGSSYGLYNVNERIKLFAGNASGLEIHSSQGMGTTVTVWLKAVLANKTE
ncbi:sensor histidine kinase [Paenibacillus sp. YN15]|uniref:cache domain-containing sensor histidine kinase n=1 Tax=Paenibacillus sp. YN15 TaxID=1742774 RepID=UPI000DCE92E2|nr:sensor histidine kinase [Paenibacillus sp. YN15]RAV02319.1 sensor histidine kinase [Paenibacillus sp. YN15]